MEISQRAWNDPKDLASTTREREGIFLEYSRGGLSYGEMVKALSRIPSLKNKVDMD